MRTRVPWFALAGLAAVTAISLPAHASPSLLTLHDFAPGAAGAQPIDPLVYGSDGNIYGVTQYGGSAGNGANGFGTVYKMTQAGVVTTLYNFTGNAGGYNPWALTQGSDGNLYGVTETGGSGYYGTIFKVTTTGTFTTLHNFTNGPADGRYPYSPPMLAADGNLYGVTENGGANNDGMIYKLTPGGTFSDIHDFAGTDGFAPRCTFVQTVDGTLYGTTDTGTGSAQWGSFFSIHTDGSNFSNHIFTGTNGYGPGGKLVLLGDGNFYGCTGEGGANGHGTVFRVTPAGVITDLHSFNVTDGDQPTTQLTLGSDGKLYGTCYSGGANGNGDIFQITSPTTTATFADIHDFTNAEGLNCTSSVVQASNGFLYGTWYNTPTSAGGIFKSTTAGVVSVAHQFTSTDASNPLCDLVQAPDGSFYGTTQYGGQSSSGTIFRVNLDGTTTTLHSFNGLVDGESPTAGLTLGADGLLYGTCSSGGANRWGTAFKMTTSGQFTLLHSFASTATDAGKPYAPLTQGNDGNFYGTSIDGGANNKGTVYKMTPDGVVTVIYSGNSGATDVAYLTAPLLKAADGSFYGATGNGGASTVGALFHVTTGGALSIVHSFNTTDGAYPRGSVVIASDGNIYGTAGSGGANSEGVVYKVATSGSGYTILHSFTGTYTDGGNVVSGLLLASNGVMYGRTSYGGAHAAGTIYTVDTSSNFNVLLSLPGPTDYSNHADLIQAADGSFYGTLYVPGANTDGSVFRMVVDTNAHNQVIFQNASSNAVSFWNVWNSTVVSTPTLSVTPGAGWNVVGSADFNQDGHPDLLLQNSTSYKLFIYHDNGATFVNGTSTDSSPAVGLKVVGVGSFGSTDGYPDILLQSNATHSLQVWHTNDYHIMTKTNISQLPASGWSVVGVGDFNGDGKSDIVFQNATSHKLAVWYMNGLNYTSGFQCATVPTGNFTGAAVVNLSGKGYPDIVFQKASGTAATVFHMGANFTVSSQSTLPAPATGENIVGPR